MGYDGMAPDLKAWREWTKEHPENFYGDIVCLTPHLPLTALKNAAAKMLPDATLVRTRRGMGI